MLSHNARRLLREIENAKGWGISREWTKAERQALFELKIAGRIELRVRGDRMTMFPVVEDN